MLLIVSVMSVVITPSKPPLRIRDVAQMGEVHRCKALQARIVRLVARVESSGGLDAYRTVTRSACCPSLMAFVICRL